MIAWYYLAIFRHQRRYAGDDGRRGMGLSARANNSAPNRLPVILSDFAFEHTAVAMPASVIVQFCLITTVALFAHHNHLG